MRKRIFAVACVVLVALAWRGEAATYYVDRNHAGASDGAVGSESKPWKTIQHAVDSVGPGDTVYIKAGTYRERVMLTGSDGTSGKSGTAAQGHITYAGYPGHEVVLDGSTFSGWGCGMASGKWAVGSRALNYIHIKDLTVRNYPEHGITFEADDINPDGCVGSHHIIIENVTVHDCGNEGILIQGGDQSVGGESYDILIRGCTTYNNGHHGVKFTGEESGIFTRRQARDCIVENTVSHHNGWSGVDGIGIYASTGSKRITFRNNVCYNNMRHGLGGHQVFDCTFANNVSYANGQGGEEYERHGIVLWSSKNIAVLNNRIYDNPEAGISFSREQAGSSHRIENNVIFDNGANGISLYHVANATVRHNTLAGNDQGLRADNSDGGNVIKGNIFYQNTSQIQPGSGDTHDYNLYYPNVNFGGKGAHAVSGNPLFAAAAAKDYHLTPGSPAINAAVALGVSADIENNARPKGSGYDLGAYEFTPPSAMPAAPERLRIVE